MSRPVVIRALKWGGIVLGGLVALVLLALTGLFIYINYEPPKTEEQKQSLEIIQKLKNTAQPEIDVDKLPDVKPEIYDDSDVDDGYDGAMGDDNAGQGEHLAHEQPATREHNVGNQ